MAMTPMWHSGAGSVKAGYDMSDIMTEPPGAQQFEVFGATPMGRGERTAVHPSRPSAQVPNR
jgi:hypothetical protein